MSDTKTTSELPVGHFKLPAVIVPAGAPDGVMLRGKISDPVRISVRIQQKGSAGQNKPSPAPGQGRTPAPDQATPIREPGRQPIRQTQPTEAFGLRSMAPRGKPDPTEDSFEHDDADR